MKGTMEVKARKEEAIKRKANITIVTFAHTIK